MGTITPELIKELQNAGASLVTILGFLFLTWQLIKQLPNWFKFATKDDIEAVKEWSKAEFATNESINTKCADCREQFVTKESVTKLELSVKDGFVMLNSKMDKIFDYMLGVKTNG